MEFLKRIDVPSESMVSLADIQSRVQVFRLSSLDPEKLIEIINQMNILEPTTRVSVDKDNNALIVSGSAADRYVVDSLIKRLDGSSRSFHVLPLRRLEPSEVAESIAFLMGQQDEEDDSSSRYSYRYYYTQPDAKKKKDEFRVAANTRFKQVLLWANDQEMQEVESLLVKLGELPPPGGSKRTMRVIDASATPETFEYLQRLRQQWNRISPNPLELPDQEQFKEPNDFPSEKDQPADDEIEDGQTPPSDDPGKPSLDDRIAGAGDTTYRLTLQHNDEIGANLADNDASDAEAADRGPGSPIRSSSDFDQMLRGMSDGKTSEEPPAEKKKGGSPIRIEIDDAGNLVLLGSDTEALDRLENLMLQIKPPKRPYHVFHIKHASASWMRLNLEDYYRDLDENDSSDSDDFFRFYWGYDSGGSDDDSPSGLGKGAKLKFVDDLDTNTLVVSGATAEQLRTIAELIELWDVPEPINKRKVRFTRLVNIQYGQAEKIAETVKDAYRDLLSSNDKAFASGRGQNNGGGAQQATKSRNGGGSGLQSSESGRDAGGADFSFKGKLSLGVDSVGNTLLVSAEGEPLLELVTDMVKQLDEAARPQGEIQVFQLPGGISGDTLRNALKPMGIEPTTKPLTRTPEVAPKERVK